MKKKKKKNAFMCTESSLNSVKTQLWSIVWFCPLRYENESSHEFFVFLSIQSFRWFVCLFVCLFIYWVVVCCCCCLSYNFRWENERYLSQSQRPAKFWWTAIRWLNGWIDWRGIVCVRFSLSSLVGYSMPWRLMFDGFDGKEGKMLKPRWSFLLLLPK